MACQAPSIKTSPNKSPDPTEGNTTLSPEPTVKNLVSFDPAQLPQDFQYPENLYKNFNNLGFRLLRALHTKKPKQNIVFSPELIGSSLLQLYFLATPKVQASILELLKLDAETVEQEYPYFVKQALHQDIEDANMTLRHALWLNQDLSIFPTQQQRLQKHGLELFSADFRQPATQEAIHKWYQEVTPDMSIPDLNGLSNKPALLSNLAAFAGRWHKDFYTSLTHKAKFWLQSGQSIQAAMMTNYNPEGPSSIYNFSFSYSKHPDFERLGYGGQGFAMLWVLPAQHSSVAEQLTDLDYDLFEAQLRGPESEQYSRIPGKDWDYEYGKVTVPKLNLNQSQTLNEILRNLEVQDSEQLLQLNALLETPTGLGPSELNTQLEVNERGISASSSLAIYPLASTTVPFEFTANRPFYFIVRTNQPSKVDRISYMGVVMDPTQP